MSAEKDAITATLTVKNNGTEPVEDLVLESIVPEDYVLADGEAKKAVDLLTPGFSMQLQVKLLPEGVQESEIVGKEETEVSGEEESEEAMLVVSEKEEQRSFPWWLVIILIALAVAVIVIIALKHRKGAALVLCFVMAGTVLAAIAVPVQAAAMGENTIVVKEFVTVNGAQLILCATVIYKVEDAAQSGGAQQPSATPAPSPALSEAEKYLDEHGVIVTTTDAGSAAGLMSEGEAVEEIADRGFNDFPVNYLHDTTGNRGDETAAKQGSAVKHPMYTTFHRTSDGELWTIYVVNDCVMATPVGYNLNQGTQATVVLSETGTILTYDEETNRFIENIPDGTVCVVKKVDKITPQTLETMTKEELDKR